MHDSLCHYKFVTRFKKLYIQLIFKNKIINRYLRLVHIKKNFEEIFKKYWITLLKASTIVVSFDYYLFMTEFYSASSSISPLTVILWCLYPMAALVLIELLLGGGFDDDNNDDQDGGMLIPAYSLTNV